MFCFTLEDLKLTLSNLTPEIRRSLYGLYKHKEYENLGNYLVKNNLGYFVGCKVYLNYPFDKIEVVLRNLKQLVKYQTTIVSFLVRDSNYIDKSQFSLFMIELDYFNQWKAVFQNITNKLTEVKSPDIQVNLLLFELDKLIKFINATENIRAYCEECRVHKVRVNLPNKIEETKGLPNAIKKHLINLI